MQLVPPSQTHTVVITSHSLRPLPWERRRRRRRMQVNMGLMITARGAVLLAKRQEAVFAAALQAWMRVMMAHPMKTDFRCYLVCKCGILGWVSRIT